MRIEFLGRARLVATATLACMALAALPPAVAADASQEVRFFGPGGCGQQGWQIEVAADVPIIASHGWGAGTKGLVRDFMHGSHNTMTVDELDVFEGYWGTVFFAAPYWAARQYFEVGSLASGESMSVTLDIYLNHRILDGFSYYGEQHPSFFGPGEFFDPKPVCTITAV